MTGEFQCNRACHADTWNSPVLGRVIKTQQDFTSRLPCCGLQVTWPYRFVGPVLDPVPVLDPSLGAELTGRQLVFYSKSTASGAQPRYVLMFCAVWVRVWPSVLMR